MHTQIRVLRAGSSRPPQSLRRIPRPPPQTAGTGNGLTPASLPQPQAEVYLLTHPRHTHVPAALQSTGAFATLMPLRTAALLLPSLRFSRRWHHAAPSVEANLRYGHSETASQCIVPGREANPRCGSHQPPPGSAAPQPMSSCPSAGPLPHRRGWQELLKAPSSRQGHSTGTELQLCHGPRAPCPTRHCPRRLQGLQERIHPRRCPAAPRSPPQSSSAVNPKTNAWQAAASGMREGYSAEEKGRCWSTADRRGFSQPLKKNWFTIRKKQFRQFLN